MDIYEREVERLTNNPDDIYDSWSEFTPLFQRVSMNQSDFTCQHGKYGCLTQIRRGSHIGRCFTNEIMADTRIPCNETDIKPEHLPIIAEWQRKIDKELDRNPPVSNKGIGLAERINV